MKKLIAIMLACCMILTLGITAFAGSSGEEISEEENGAVAAELTTEEKNAIADLVLSYMECATSSANLRGLTGVSAQVRADAQRRATAFDELESRIGATFDSVVHDVKLCSATLTRDGNISADVYDAVYITYYYPDNEDLLDYCAYGVWHTMEFSEQNGEWRIEKDSFDERDLTGVASNDILLAERENTVSEQPEPIYNGEPPRSVTFNYTAAKINQAIQYAVTYCGLSTSQSGRLSSSTSGWLGNSNGSPSNYNSLYVSYHNNGGDCCNYVSQCLYAAGHPTNSNWCFTYSGSQRNGSNYWIRVWQLVAEFKSTSFTNYSDAAVNSTYSNVYTGNPVYWYAGGSYSSDHIMICVGKNNGGVPVLCGHTTDMYRWPISAVSGNTLFTMYITTSENHSHSYVYTSLGSSNHRRTCQYCEITAIVSHVYNNNGRCIYCGYDGFGSVEPIEE